MSTKHFDLIDPGKAVSRFRYKKKGSSSVGVERFCGASLEERGLPRVGGDEIRRRVEEHGRGI